MFFGIPSLRHYCLLLSVSTAATSTSVPTAEPDQGPAPGSHATVQHAT